MIQHTKALYGNRTDAGNEFITFKANKAKPIAIQRKYHGISTQVTGYIKNVRFPFNVGICVGAVIVPHPEKRNIQTQLDGYDKPIILVHSLESTIAEKVDAIRETLQNRGTVYGHDSFERILTMSDDKSMQTKWLYFLRTLGNTQIPFDDVMNGIGYFWKNFEIKKITKEEFNHFGEAIHSRWQIL